MLERLQKIISRAGIASRRHAEQLILSGAVSVNGQVVTELGTKADPERDHITVGPRTVKITEAPERYLAFYKPPQVVSTMSDPERRPCLGPYLRGFKGRLFPVGRLDFDHAGLLLLTSDGTLASDLMRAAAVVPQTWRFKVKGRIPPEALRGIERAAGARLRVYRDAPNAWYEAELAVGGGRRARLEQALQRNSILVEKMLRWKFAGVDLGSLAPGEMCDLTRDEVRSLRRAVTGRRPQQPRPHAPPHAAAAPEHPERAALARAVEEWRTAHPRKARGPVPYGTGRSKQRPYGGGRDSNRNRRGRHGKNHGLGRREA
jgi:23S rRNA pseudouridine2605 synthase